MGSTGDLAAEVVGTVVHDETASRTELYLVVWSGVRADFGGTIDLEDGWAKGVRRISEEGFSDVVEVEGGANWAFFCGSGFVVWTVEGMEDGAVEGVFCSIEDGGAC